MVSTCDQRVVEGSSSHAGALVHDFDVPHVTFGTYGGHHVFELNGSKRFWVCDSGYSICQALLATDAKCTAGFHIEPDNDFALANSPSTALTSVGD